MVNLLPDEMKKEEEGQDFNKKEEKKEKSDSKKDFLMTKPAAEVSSSKKKSPAFLKKLRDFIFKKKKIKKIKPVKTSSSPKQSSEGEKKENKDKVPEFSPNKKKKEEKNKKKESSSGLGVSLMPEETMIISRVVRSRLIFLVLSIVIISVLFILARLYGGLYFDKKLAEVENIKREINLLEVESKGFLEQRNMVISLNNKAEEVQRALDEHIYWRNFFNFLENYTLPEVYFGDFTAQAQEPVRLNAQAKNLIFLARQIVALREADDLVEKVEVSGVQKDGEGDGVQALLEITLFEDIWQK